MRTFERILAISDIHGQNTKLLSLLEKANYHAESDLLIICGDIIDRGTENLATIATCKDLLTKGAIILMGNHEQMAIQCINDMMQKPESVDLTDNIFYWTHYNGGSNFYNELCTLTTKQLQQVYEFFKELPQYFCFGNFIFSHGGANINKPINENDVDELLWMDNNFPFSPAYKDKIMIFGHVPTFRLTNIKNKKCTKIWYDAIHKDKIGIDCGSIMGGRLAALELPSYHEFYV